MYAKLVKRTNIGSVVFFAAKILKIYACCGFTEYYMFFLSKVNIYSRIRCELILNVGDLSVAFETWNFTLRG